jgi:hypothetical protein
MIKITAPISAIIISLILCLTFLMASGSLLSARSNYATAKFDGGYQVLGLIKRQELFSEVVEQLGNKESQFDSIADYISDTKGLESDSSRAIFKVGTIIKATTGIKWEGSEGNLKLNTDTLTLYSTASKPLNVQEVLSALNDFENKSKSEAGAFVKRTIQIDDPLYSKSAASKLTTMLINSRK